MKITKHLQTPRRSDAFFSVGVTPPTFPEGLAFCDVDLSDSSEYYGVLPTYAVKAINSAIEATLSDPRILQQLHQLEEQLRIACNEPAELMLDIKPILATYPTFPNKSSFEKTTVVPKITFEFKYHLPLGVWSPRRLCDGILTAWNFDIFKVALPPTIPSQVPTAYIPIMTNFDPEIDAMGTVITLPNTELLLKYNSTGKVPGGITRSPSILKFTRVRQEGKPLHYHNAVIAYAAKDNSYFTTPLRIRPPEFLVNDLAERLMLLLWAYVRCHQQLLDYDLANML
jgi:hypothetical protein